MRTPIIAAGLLLMVAHFVDAAVFQSDSTRKNISDSARIYFGPNYHNNTVERIYSSATVNDPKLFHLSAGVNVLNTLRGQSANLLMSNNAYGTVASLRTGTPLYVIDGVPTRNPETFYNLNASEYQHISVINSGNVAARYAGGGLNSTIFLQRKTGVDVAEPSFEFTSYTTYASNEVADNFWEGSKGTIKQWMFTNGIAYAQDFGAVDTRVSYTYARFPSVDQAYDGASVHTTSINTGLELGRFNARLILDQFSRLNEAHTYRKYFNADAGNGSSQTENFLQGNLALNYRFSDWANVSSAIVFNYLDDKLNRIFTEHDTGTPETNTYEHQSRAMVNLFLSGSSPSNKKIRFNYSVGAQTDATTLDTQLNVVNDDGVVIIEVNKWLSETIAAKSLLAETGIQMGDDFILTFNYQHNKFDNYTNNTITTGFAFDFNNAFHINPDILSTGRFRGNFGKADILNNTVFPYPWESYIYAANNIPTQGKHIEGGFDFGFLNNRFTLSMTYLHNFGLDEFPTSGYAFAPLNRVRHAVELGKITYRGWEIVAGADVINKSAFRWNAKLTWGKIDPLVDDEGYYYYDGSPEWKSGLLNQFQIDKWFVSLLIDSRYHGGESFDRYLGGELVREGEVDLQMKLRDVSVAYELFAKSKSSTLVLHKLLLSLSARNMWTIYSSLKPDTEKVSYLYTAQKNVSLSITASF